MNWQPIETRPDEGEFLAYDPVSRKYDVCYPTFREIYGYLDVLTTGKPYSTRRRKVGERKSCEAVQQDGEYGPFDDEFVGDRATHWMPLPHPPEDVTK